MGWAAGWAGVGSKFFLIQNNIGEYHLGIEIGLRWIRLTALFKGVQAGGLGDAAGWDQKKINLE